MQREEGRKEERWQRGARLKTVECMPVWHGYMCGCTCMDLHGLAWNHALCSMHVRSWVACMDRFWLVHELGEWWM